MPEFLHFGGSFNPPHFAHAACAAAACRAAKLDGVVLVPTGAPTLKDTRDVAPAADRLAMTRLAAADAAAVHGLPVTVDDLELHRPGTTYTIDTVDALIAKGVRPVHWLVGADQLLNLHRWRRYDALLRTATLWVMARPGYAIDWDAVDPVVRTLRDHVVVVPAMDVSATDIRRRVRAGGPIDGWVCPGVAAYVRDRGLYRAKG